MQNNVHNCNLKHCSPSKQNITKLHTFTNKIMVVVFSVCYPKSCFTYRQLLQNLLEGVSMCLGQMT